MKNIKIFLIGLLIILILPFIAKADTWLDKEEYRDTSWFNENTYDTTTDYIIDSKEKVAGLLYLVNIKEYTFENKTIHIVGDEYIEDICQYQTEKKCALNMTSHDWIPLKSYFSGSFYPYKTGYIYIKNINNKNNFTEKGVCNIGDNVDVNCFVSEYKSLYSTHVNISDNGHISTIPEYVEKWENINIEVSPDEGYYLDDFLIIDKYHNSIVITKRKNENTYNFIVPAGEIEINVSFKKIADNSCIVISGNGKNIGDEIKCGEEHFYVLSNKDGKIRMMAKYNLNTGVSIYKEKQPEGKTCSDLAIERGGILKSDEFYNAPGYCFYTKILPYIKVIQDKEAKSAHWDADLNYLYPQVGDVYIKANTREIVPHQNSIDDSYFTDFDLVVNLTNSLESFNDSTLVFSSYPSMIIPLYQYKERLNKSMGIEIQNIELLSLSELNDIIYNISNKKIPLKEWGEQVETIQTSHNSPTEIHFGDIKPFIPTKYKWLYSTTYWNSTTFSSPSVYTYSNRFFVFTAEQGKLCGAGFDACAPTTTLGCGIRPVITINENDLKYEIKTITDGNGTIEVVKMARGNERISFKAIPNSGYKLDSIVITTDSGEKVEFTEEEIEKDENGTLIINKNKFTMPFENITIEAKWKKEQILEAMKQIIANPNTVDNLIMILPLLIGSLGLLIYLFIKRKEQINKLKI